MFKTLIVEDNATFRQTLKETLGSRFPLMAIHEATDREEALQKADGLVPDLIFMDIKLPGGNGLELTKTIKANYPKTIIIILTNYDFPEYQEAAYQSGANCFMSKGSISGHKIVKLVESLLFDSKETGL